MDRKEQIKQLENDWKTNPRWKNVKRGYTAEDVVRLRGSFVPECSLAKKGADKLWSLVNGTAKKGYVNCLGALTGGQAMQQVKAGIEAISTSIFSRIRLISATVVETIPAGSSSCDPHCALVFPSTHLRKFLSNRLFFLNSL